MAKSNEDEKLYRFDVDEEIVYIVYERYLPMMLKAIRKMKEKVKGGKNGSTERQARLYPDGRR